MSPLVCRTLPPLLLLAAALAQLAAGSAASASSVAVVAVEDTNNAGFYVGTSPTSYAYIVSPGVSSLGYNFISLNSEQVIIGTESNRTYAMDARSVNATVRDFMDECYSRFGQDLAYPMFAGAAEPAQGRSLVGVPLVRGYPARPAPVELVGPPTGGAGAAPAGTQYKPAGQRYPKPAPAPSAVHKKYLATAAAKAPPGSGAGTSKPPAPALYATYNYRNLQGTLLNETLSGDLYTFDARGNILDIYSTTVSVSQAPGGQSTLYRDAAYYSYARPNMANGLVRLFYVAKHLFLVYSDLRVEVKPSWQLDHSELELLAAAKGEISDIQLAWPYK